MKNKELFNRTVAVLVKAYQNNTLIHGDCRACAVGILVAAGCGIDDIFDDNEWRIKASSEDFWDWPFVFATSDNGEQLIIPENYRDSAKFQIDATGYTWEQLAKIEYAFETAPRGYNDDDWMLNGLLAVYEVLCEIHGVADGEVQDARLVFVR